MGWGQEFSQSSQDHNLHSFNMLEFWRLPLVAECQQCWLNPWAWCSRKPHDQCIMNVNEDFFNLKRKFTQYLTSSMWKGWVLDLLPRLVWDIAREKAFPEQVSDLALCPPSSSTYTCISYEIISHCSIPFSYIKFLIFFDSLITLQL